MLVPINDLNENGEIDSYYVWIETDEYTLDGYWIYYNEGADYYWTDPNGNPVAYSDAEFYQYHYQNVVEMYNEDNKNKEYQAEVYAVIGLDFAFGDIDSKIYTHIWVNVFPYSYGLTNKAFTDNKQYDIGLLIGTNLSEHIGVFIEGSKQNLYNREEMFISTGLNWRF